MYRQLEEAELRYERTRESIPRSGSFKRGPDFRSLQAHSVLWLTVSSTRIKARCHNLKFVDLVALVIVIIVVLVGVSRRGSSRRRRRRRCRRFPPPPPARCSARPPPPSPPPLPTTTTTATANTLPQPHLHPTAAKMKNVEVHDKKRRD